MGLSPRARGNPARPRPAETFSGPIPAGAGEPCLTPCACTWSGAYPRGRGGTAGRTQTAPPSTGLSPRARGNRPLRAKYAGSAGPIPAGAGEPGRRRGRRAVDGAYPRGRGGTQAALIPMLKSLGLSPRARGNPRRYRGGSTRTGPIPAGAGEPQHESWSYPSVRAYPRGRGGTSDRLLPAGAGEGLSPRARGNRRDPHTPDADKGPIPAGAGEPPICAARISRVRAYPRGRGGTHPGEVLREDFLGLAPRARGNPLSPIQGPRPRGPIPAGAGEPHTPR